MHFVHFNTQLAIMLVLWAHQQVTSDKTAKEYKESSILVRKLGIPPTWHNSVRFLFRRCHDALSYQHLRALGLGIERHALFA